MNNNQIQVTNANISIKVTSAGDYPKVGEYTEIKLNNFATGIIGLNNLELYS